MLFIRFTNSYTAEPQIFPEKIVFCLLLKIVSQVCQIVLFLATIEGFLLGRWVVAVQVMETKQSEEIFYASDGEKIRCLLFLWKIRGCEGNEKSVQKNRRIP